MQGGREIQRFIYNRDCWRDSNKSMMAEQRVRRGSGVKHGVRRSGRSRAVCPLIPLPPSIPFPQPRDWPADPGASAQMGAMYNVLGPDRKALRDISSTAMYANCACLSSYCWQ